MYFILEMFLILKCNLHKIFKSSLNINVCMIKLEISNQLYEDFLEEISNLESTLSTIEILQD